MWAHLSFANHAQQVYTYFVADFTTKHLAKKDLHGFSEPESRLVTALPSAVHRYDGSSGIRFRWAESLPPQAGWVFNSATAWSLSDSCRHRL